MSEGHLQRQLLRLAWVLPVFVLLCGLQLGWPDLSWLKTTVSSAVGKPQVWLLAVPQAEGHAAENSTAGSRPEIEPDPSSSAGLESERTSIANSGGSHGIGGDAGMQCDGPFNIPKVALLFLVRGPIHHERTWAAWLDDAAGLVPTSAAVHACCRSADEAQQAVSSQAADSTVPNGPQPAKPDNSSTAVQPGSMGNSGAASAPASEAETAAGPVASSAQPVPADISTSTAATVAAADAPAAEQPAISIRDVAAAPAASDAAASMPSSEQLAAPASRRLLQRDESQRRRLQAWWPKLWRAAKQRHGQPGKSSIVAAQRLFSVYVHPAPDFAAYPDGHLFRGLELPVRVQAGWGQHNLTRAMRLLLGSAVKDPANQRFMFLDETSIPLYPPHLTWAQLVFENRTRMTACEGPPAHLLRHIQWLPQFETPYLKPHMWRKSSQWSMITRRHAEVLVADTEVWDAITPLCDARKVVDPATNTSKPYPCISDEHYFPSTLAAAGLGNANESTCAGNAMHVDWGRSRNRAHPFTYWQADTNTEAINTVRAQLGKCPYANAIRDANLLGNFETAASLRHFACPAAMPTVYRMPYADRVDEMVKCSLFSRKWAASASDLVFEALTNATDPTGILADWRGRRRTQQEAAAGA